MIDLSCKYVLPDDLYPVWMETMGSRIRQLRLARGMTQQELGDACDVSKAAVSQWENDATANIKLKALLKLTAILGTDLDYLVYGPVREPDGGSKSRTGRFRTISRKT